MHVRSFTCGVALMLALAGCGDDDATPIDAGPGIDASPGVDAGPETDAGGDTDAGPACDATPNEATYVFESRFVDGESSVAYSGQTFRQVLIAELTGFIDDLGDLIDADAAGNLDEESEIVAALDFYYRFDSASNGEEPHGFTTDPEALQQLWNDISSDKDLFGKLAGQDSVTDHADWNGGDFAGWADTDFGGTDSPAALVQAFFDALAENAVLRAEGSQPTGPEGEALPVYVLADGRDLKQLTQKFLLMAVAFSQGADDYLDDDTEDKGLLSSNERAGESTYSTLEHQWDEGFGYFGAARDYDMYTDDEIASAGGRDDWQGLHDTNGDCRIDLTAEVNFAASVNAAKRDRGATVATDFTGDAFQAFVDGRALIASVEGPLSEAQLDELRGYRDAALAAWEAAYAATVVHYINDTLADMDAFGTEDYSFTDHAKHWSELKGFALGFQFNRFSPMLESIGSPGVETRFTRFHALVGDAPVLADAGETAIADYRAALEEARELVGEAYGFDEDNLTDW